MIKKQSVDYTLVKNILNQIWRYKTLAVIKRHKKHLLYVYFSTARDLVQQTENRDKIGKNVTIRFRAVVPNSAYTP